MVSDDELKRRVAAYEQSDTTGGHDLETRIDKLERDARDVHGELSRRLERAERESASRRELDDVVERIERIEDRLDELADGERA